MMIDVHPGSIALVAIALLTAVVVAEIAMSVAVRHGAPSAIKKWIRIAAVSALALAVPIVVFTGGGWKAPGHQLEDPPVPPIMDRTRAPRADVQSDGRDIQDESVLDLNEFREEFYSKETDE